MGRLAWAIALVVGVAALTAGACGPDGGNGTCANASAPTCPATPPSFSGEVNTLIQSRCVGCHAPGGLASNRPFTSYDVIKNQAGPMLNQLFNCRMPPADAPQPTDAERATLLAWLACGAPNN